MRFRGLRLLSSYLHTAIVRHPRVRLARLTLDLWQADAAYRLLVRDSRARGSGKDRDEDDFYYERRLVTDEIDSVRSRMLARKVERLDIEIAITAEDWERSELLGTVSLKSEKMRQIRQAVRTAEAERWVAREARLKVLGTVLSTAAGLVGALIGLVAILHK